MDALPGGVTVTRIGTQVVVRLSGHVGDGLAPGLHAALAEVATLVINRVVVDLEDVCTVEGAGIEFLGELNQRWQLRLINRPGGLGVRLPPRADRRELIAGELSTGRLSTGRSAGEVQRQVKSRR